MLQEISENMIKKELSRFELLPKRILRVNRLRLTKMKIANNCGVHPLHDTE